MKSTANKIPTTTASSVGLSDQSYLLLSPFLAQPPLQDSTPDPDEPDIWEDDVTFRILRDTNASHLPEVQPKFGFRLFW